MTEDELAAIQPLLSKLSANGSLTLGATVDLGDNFWTD
jgi:hypothetical protein